jgi:hypothetical protein
MSARKKRPTAESAKRRTLTEGDRQRLALAQEEQGRFEENLLADVFRKAHDLEAVRRKPERCWEELDQAHAALERELDRVLDQVLNVMLIERVRRLMAQAFFKAVLKPLGESVASLEKRKRKPDPLVAKQTAEAASLRAQKGKAPLRELAQKYNRTESAIRSRLWRAKKKATGG